MAGLGWAGLGWAGSNLTASFLWDCQEKSDPFMFLMACKIHGARDMEACIHNLTPIGKWTGQYWPHHFLMVVIISQTKPGTSDSLR